jgi:hypothetical protein
LRFTAHAARIFFCGGLYLGVHWLHHLLEFALLFQMNTRNWNILCWSIRGLNAIDKHDAVRNKIEENGCSNICLHETKFWQVDMQLVRKFAPRRFDKFDFVPSAGASGGILVLWNSSLFQGTTLNK